MSYHNHSEAFVIYSIYGFVYAVKGDREGMKD